MSASPATHFHLRNLTIVDENGEIGASRIVAVQDIREEGRQVEILIDVEILENVATETQLNKENDSNLESCHAGRLEGIFSAARTSGRFM